MTILSLYALLPLVHGLPLGLRSMSPGSAFASRKGRTSRLLCWAGITHCLLVGD